MAPVVQSAAGGFFRAVLVVKIRLRRVSANKVIELLATVAGMFMAFNVGVIPPPTRLAPASARAR